MTQHAEMVDLTDEQAETIEYRLEAYDNSHIMQKLKGGINIGIMIDGNLIGGVVACVTTFKILYISSVYVDESYRGNGLGSMLMKEVEERAIAMGINIIRLDTFNWQGVGFYGKIGYEQVGFYENESDGYSEHFFIKRLIEKLILC